VLDAGFSAILARACLDLAHVAEELGEPRMAEESRSSGERVAAALRARAAPDGTLGAVDAVDEAPLPVTSAGSALALLAPGLSHKQVAVGRALVLDGALVSRYGVRSLDRAHPECSARNYWRGPVWAAITWLTALGLGLHGDERAARALVERMQLAIDGGGMREYFSPESGRGLGASHFTWTAALCLRAAART
jgi:glycogen debranching enzyme